MLARLRRGRLLGDVRKVEVEDDVGPVDCARDDEVRVHRAAVAVDHEVRIDPVVERAVARPDGAGSRLGAVADDRARLQAEALAVLDRVAAVVEHAVEPLVQDGDVVAAVEIVVDEDLPVAVERVAAPLHPVQGVEAELLHPARSRSAPRNSSSEGPAGSSLTKIHFSQTAVSTGTSPFAARSKSHTPAKSGVPFSCAVERVRPAVIRTAEAGRRPLRARSRPPPHDDGRR